MMKRKKKPNKKQEVFTCEKKDGWCLVSSYRHDEDGRVYQGYINVSAILDFTDEVVLRRPKRTTNRKAARSGRAS